MEELRIEDIEDLGFTHLKKQSLKGLTERFEILTLHNRIHPLNDDASYWNVYLKYHPDIHSLIITADVSDGSRNEKFFEGNINTKEQLHTVLKMLNIIEDEE